MSRRNGREAKQQRRLQRQDRHARALVLHSGCVRSVCHGCNRTRVMGMDRGHHCELCIGKVVGRLLTVPQRPDIEAPAAA